MWRSLCVFIVGVLLPIIEHVLELAITLAITVRTAVSLPGPLYQVILFGGRDYKKY